MMSNNGLRPSWDAVFWSSVFAFFSMVPGTALLIFGGGRSTAVPEPIIEFLFPFTVLPPEKFLIVTLARWIFGVEITFDDFYRIDVFIQQFFVLSFLFFFLILIGLILFAIVSGVDLLAERPKSSVFLKPLVIMFLLREGQMLALVINPASLPSHNSRAHLSFMFMRAIAPEILIFVNCTIAVIVFMLMLMAYRGIFER